MGEHGPHMGVHGPCMDAHGPHLRSKFLEKLSWSKYLMGINKDRTPHYF